MNEKSIAFPVVKSAARYTLPCLIIIAGLLLSITAFVTLRSWEQYKVRTGFEEDAQNRYAALKRESEFNMHVILALQAFYGHTEVVSREEFQDFVRPFLSYYRSVQALEWVVRIPESQRAFYEEKARRDGLSGFKLREQQPDGEMTEAARREEYYPVYFIEPFGRNAHLFGFDLASNPKRREALERSRDTGEKVATARILQETGKQFGLLVFAPVYHRGVPSDTVEMRQKNLIGFVVGAFRIGDIVEESLARLSPAGIDVYVYDTSAREEESFLYYHPSRLRQEMISSTETETETFARDERLEYSGMLDVAGRKWLIRCVSDPNYIANRTTWTPWGALTVGLLLTALLTSRILVNINRSRQIERLVAERTRELNKTNEMLEQEIAVRKKTEDELQLAYEELDHRVRERTRELSFANKQFQHEIAERKLSEEALKASEEKMRLIIESSPVGIRICRNGRYVYVNPAFARMFGYEMRDEIIGCPLDDLYAPEDREWVRQKLMNRPEDRLLPIAYEARGVTKNGSYLDLAVWVTTIEYRGEPASLAFVVDVSSEKSLKAQLYQAQKLEAIGTLAGGVAHDFNNILGIILGYTELVLFDTPPESDASEPLEQVVKACRRAKDLVRQILTFSRRGEQERKPLFISSIVKEALKMLRASLPSTIEIRRNIDIEQGQDSILADPTQVRQVLMNLCTNAGYAMNKQGGVLEVSLSAVCFGPDTPDRPVDLNSGSYVQLTVKDTGEGMERARYGKDLRTLFHHQGAR